MAGKIKPNVLEQQRPWTNSSLVKVYIRRKLGRSIDGESFAPSSSQHLVPPQVKKILAKDPGRQIGCVKLHSKEFTISEIADLLINTHFPDCRQVAFHDVPLKFYHIPSPEDSQRAGQIVSDRIRWTTKSFQPYKFSGMVGIFPALPQWGLGELQVDVC